MNQYQACLDSFELIFHKDSKYSNQITEWWHLYNFVYILVLSSAHARRVSVCVTECISRGDTLLWIKIMREAVHRGGVLMGISPSPALIQLLPL